MDIYVFKRADGHEWADFRLPEDAVLLQKIHAETPSEIQKVADSNTGRVQALAERALAEAVLSSPTALAERGLLGRLKWLFAGK